MQKDAGGRGGVIVNISSVAGLYSLSQLPVYSATEHAGVAFSRSFAVSSALPRKPVVLFLTRLLPIHLDDFTATLSLRENRSKDNGPVPRAFTDVQCERFGRQSLAGRGDTEVHPKVFSLMMIARIFAIEL